MVEFKNETEIAFVTNSSQFDYLKEDFQELIKILKLNYQQLSKIVDLPINEIENLMNNKGNLTSDKLGVIENKLAMLNHGFGSFDARERATYLLNDLLKDYMLSTDIVSKMIHVDEQELIDFRQKQLMDKDIELKICVNVTILHFVLHD